MKANITIHILIFTFLSTQIISASDWYKIEGQYSYVEYEKVLALTADSLLIIAETWIPRFCELSGVPDSSFLEDKARIILTDAPDITNGYAIGHDIVIFALSSMFVPNWSENESWYETVLKHELVHQIIFRATNRKINALGVLASLSVPRWFHEGLAQYYAESWNTNRGDLTLQSALTDGKLNYGSLSNYQDGALLYSSANAFVRYLADQYGDSSFSKLLNHNQVNWVYDFDLAFKEVYKNDVQTVFSDFFRYMVIYYGDKLADYPDLITTEKLPMPGFRTLQIIPVSDQDSTYLAAVQLNATHQYAHILLFIIKDGETTIIKSVTNHFNTPLVYDDQNQRVAWGRFNIGTKADQFSLNYRWFVHDIRKDATIEVSQNLRSRYGAFSPSGNLILAEVNHDGSALWEFDIRRQKLSELLRTSMPIGNLDVFPNGSIIFDVQDEKNHRNLILWQDGNITRLTNDSLNNSRPVVINDSLLVFNRTIHNRPALAVYNLKQNNFRIQIDAEHTVFPVQFDKARQKLILSIKDHYQKSNIQTIALDTLLSAQNNPIQIQISPRYARWTTIIPNFRNIKNADPSAISKKEAEPVMFPQGKLMHALTFGLPLYDQDLGIGLFAMTTWMESLQRQALQLNGVLFEKGWNESLFTIGHNLRMYNLNLNSFYYHGPAIFSIADGRRLRTYQDIPGVSISRLIPFKGNMRSGFIPSLSYTYYNYRIKEDRPDFPKLYNFHGPSAGIRYHYHLPTSLYPVLPKRMFDVNLRFFTSLSSAYKFDIRQADLKLGSNLLIERLGFMVRGSLISSSGNLPPLNRVGIDRFYELDVPRDVTYTRTVRGVRQDIQSPSLLWSSSELNLVLVDNSSMKLLFIPINRLLITGFYDYAQFELQGNDEVSSYGVEANGVWSILKFGVGYAKAKVIDSTEIEEYYWRIGLILPNIN